MNLRHIPFLLGNLLVLLVFGVGLATYVWVTNEDRAREGRIHNCVALNELSRKLYVTFSDLGYDKQYLRRFLPTTHCEDLP